MSDSYKLPVPAETQCRLAAAWLWLGVTALLVSGIFSLLLVLSRAPFVSSLIPWLDFFHTALVVHVDLSVLVWFLAFAGVLWSLNSTDRFIRVGWLALGLAVAGTAIMALSPFTGDGHPLMSNYIPVLQIPAFFTGLLCFTCGVVLLVWRSMSAIPLVGQRISSAGSLRFGLNTATVATAMAMMGFIWSWLMIPDSFSGKAYYELLFWGGGHLLQFTYTLLMLVAWLWLANASHVDLPVTPRVVLIMFGFGLFAIFFTPIIYFSYPVTSGEHISLFTWLMRYGGSLASLPLSLAILYGLLRSDKCPAAQRPFRAALISSMLLFGLGGVIGFMIQGSNVTIPAHYHGSIVGVTLALMGLTYVLLPYLGYGTPKPRLAGLQPYLYGLGQMLHVIGLVWSGGYGVQRKVAGAAQGLDSVQEVAAMGLMGLGGLISIIGGFLFVWIVLQIMLRGRTAHASA